MIGRVLLAAILAGLAAGLLMGLIQHVRLTPLILQAETYEHVAHGHVAETHSHGEEEWSPANGTERTLLTTLSAVLAATGFAFLLAGVSIVSNRPIRTGNGLLWGLCGFIAVSFAPAVGLPPELPGMPAAALEHRQIWWIATIVLTALGLWVLASERPLQTKLLGFIALALPHVLWIPKIATESSTVPANLAAQFVTASLAANLVMWSAIGVLLGYFLERSKQYDQ